jgi:hypothetical protein
MENGMKMKNDTPSPRRFCRMRARQIRSFFEKFW